MFTLFLKSIRNRYLLGDYYSEQSPNKNSSINAAMFFLHQVNQQIGSFKSSESKLCQDIIPFTRHRPTQIPVFLMMGQPWSELKPDPSISQRTFVNNADTVTHTRVSKVNRNFNENQYEHMCQPVVDIPVVIYISL